MTGVTSTSPLPARLVSTWVISRGWSSSQLSVKCTDVTHPPFGRLPTRGCLCIVGGADPLGGWRDSVVGAKVDLALNQFQLLEPNLSQELYCWNMVQPVECSQLQSTGDSHLPQ